MVRLAHCARFVAAERGCVASRRMAAGPHAAAHAALHAAAVAACARLDGKATHAEVALASPEKNTKKFQHSNPAI